MDESVILNDERISILRILKNLFSRLVHGMHELKRKCTVRTFEQNGTDFLVTVKASQASTNSSTTIFLFRRTVHTTTVTSSSTGKSFSLVASEDFGYP